MKIIYNVNIRLPSLAWIATVKDGKAQVTHGSKVEIQDNFFVEGAWGGVLFNS